MPRGFIDGEYQDGELRGLTFLAGKRGMGKTTEVIRLLNLCRGPVIFFDTLAKHSLPRAAVAHQPGELKNFLRARVRQIIYQPIGGDRAEHFEDVNAIVKAIGSMIYAIDEVDRFCDANNMPDGLNDLVEYGRHHKTSMLFTARKAVQVPRRLTSECWELRLFKTTENRYVKYWAETIGDDGTANLLRTLPKYQYLLWRDDGEFEPQIMCAGWPITKTLAKVPK